MYQYPDGYSDLHWSVEKLDSAVKRRKNAAAEPDGMSKSGIVALDEAVCLGGRRVRRKFVDTVGALREPPSEEVVAYLQSRLKEALSCLATSKHDEANKHRESVEEKIDFFAQVLVGRRVNDILDDLLAKDRD